MPKFIDLSGARFGQLTVIKRANNHKQPSGKSIVMWLCRCDCGNYVEISSSNLSTGNSKQCKECNLKQFQNYLEIGQKKHGKAATRIYRVWRNIKTRCLNPNSVQYKDYGGRGIGICAEWMSFEGFYKWVLNSGYDEKAKYGEYTIERKDVNGDYCPQNCKWISISEQQLNKRTNHLITYNNETKTIKEWAEQLNFSYSMLESRLSRGWSVEDALNKPKGYRFKGYRRGAKVK